MSRIMYLLAGTALGIIAPKVTKLARDLNEKSAEGSSGRLFKKRRYCCKSAGQARKEAEKASPGTPPEPSDESAS
ncbi:MAG: hypothetical protein LBW85_03095 [Deltaproteobacteria bacterium]|jgi:hypothetical protein|nr:hypothetical protein [Deltaproteobacteria bacterium]